MKDDVTIRSVVRSGLCAQCGTCAGVCPVDAVRMVIERRRGLYLPEIDDAVCTRCGACLRACPGEEVDYPLLNRQVFGVESRDAALGFYLDCYSSYATDEAVRYTSASGGLVSTLLIDLLERGVVDGVLVTRMSRERPLEPEPFVARTRQEVLEAARSKYCPVPANLALREVRRQSGRFAVVGLPCHLHGLRKAEADEPKLAEKIVLHVGIFCGHNPSFLATDYLIQRHHIPKEGVTGIDYRGEGWPGGISIRTQDGGKTFLPHYEAWRELDVAFIPWRCMLCADGAAELSDISFGDAWLDEFSGDSLGTSAIIVRTAAGREALDRLVAEGLAVTSPLSPEKVRASQQGFVNKKAYPRLYRLYGRLVGKKLPVYHVRAGDMRLLDWLAAAVRLMGYFLSSRRCWWLLGAYTDRLLPFLGRVRRLGRAASPARR